MYAITQFGYRTITDASDAAPGEIVVAALPESILRTCESLEARRHRNMVLRACDWTQSPDSPLSEPMKALWAAYRQSLRDLPNDPEFPNCAWPEPPAGDEDGD